MAVGIYAVVVLSLIGFFSVTERKPASIQNSALCGFAIPAISSCLWAWSGALSMVSTPSALIDRCLGFVGVLILLLIVISPFLLVRKVETRAKNPKRLRETLSAILCVGMTAAGLGGLMTLGWHWAWQSYDVGCQQVVAWIKSTHPVPGNYSDLLLPASLSRFSSDSLVSAVVMADGRVAVMLTTFAGGHTVSEYIIYCTGPITPAEIGKDFYGQPEVLPNKLPEHFIERQIDTQHFEALYDLG